MNITELTPEQIERNKKFREHFEIAIVSPEIKLKSFAEHMMERAQLESLIREKEKRSNV